MKKILIVIFIIALFSCEDLLIEEPKSIVIESFYNTKDEFEAAIAGILQPIRDLNTMGGRYPGTLICLTDYAVGRGSNAPISEFQQLDATNQARVFAMWPNFYRSILRANIVISQAPKSETLTQEDIAKFVGEAKF